MSVKVIITIDTEEDEWGDYTETTGTVDNILALPRLQALFGRYGAVPTYLINYPVASQQRSIDVLKSFHDDGVCEIGTHCHPWNTPPVEEELSAENSMMCNLDYDLLIRKLGHLHRTIEQNFGVSPKVFRAGRWALGENVARCLQELGYTVDTSMSPFVDWGRQHGPDFTWSSTYPFYFDPSDLSRHDPSGCLLEIPPTVGYYQANFERCEKIKQYIRGGWLARLRLIGILDRLNLLNFNWLSPEWASGEQMVRLAKRFVRNDHEFLNMSFHSTTMLPGMSPFVKNEQDLEGFLGRIETFLGYAVENDFEFIPLSAAASGVPR